MSQESTVAKLLDKFNMVNAKQKKTPFASNHDITGIPKRVPDVAADSKIDYRSLVGVLGYPSNVTRPDLAFAVSLLSRYLTSFTQAHYDCALQALAYFKTTAHHKFTIKKSDLVDFELNAYADSD